MVMLAAGEALDRLKAAVSGLRVVPALPPGRVATLPVREPAQRMPLASVPREPTEPLGLFIEYVAGDGAASSRRITVRQIIGNPPSHLLAYCHERRAARNFRLDRIVLAVDPATGEVLALAAVLERLCGGGMVPVDAVLRRAVNILVFLMRCDGHTHPAEWDAIDDALARLVLWSEHGDEVATRACAMARQVAPDADDFLIGMRSFTHSPQARMLGRWLARAVAAVIDADDSQHPDEFRWLVEVGEFLDIMQRQAG